MWTQSENAMNQDERRPAHGQMQPSRRTVLGGAAALAAGLGLASRVAAETEATADFLFVQTALGMTYDPATGRISLQNVNPVTLFFSDRPDRVAGNMETARFVPFWSEGTDSFLSDPPNADLSMIVDGVLQQTVVVLKDPKLEGDVLSYAVDPVQGEIPLMGAQVSVFIDVIGMPLTPVSYAGVARRSFRRAAIY
jgi:hypothetical protein